jgi:hypothetical protein
MANRVLLTLLARQRHQSEGEGYTMTPTLLLVLGVLAGTLGVVAMSNSSNLAAFVSGAEARDVSEMGADRIIATWSEPENRQLLVAGSTPPDTWSTSNPKLQSPCVSTRNERPGDNNGFPTATAINLSDGQFRNLDDLSQVNTGNQRIRLKGVRYSTGPNTGGAAALQNRRALQRTFTRSSSWTLASQSGTLPAGSEFNQLLNLDDPDGGGTLLSGNNTGFIAVTVEGRAYRPDGTFSSYTTTKEFEVVPKCCGGSFGSNATNSLGADRRYCGVEFGLVTGINGGRFFSQRANDRYTSRNSSGQIVDLTSIIGVVADPTHTWTRRQVGIVDGIEIGCRTVPSPCNSTSDPEDIIPGDAQNLLIANGHGPILGQALNPAPGPCPDEGGRSIYGDQRSIEGRASACIPFAPVYFSTGLPSIASRFTYNWMAGGNPATVAALDVNSTNIPTTYGSSTNSDLRYPSFIINGPSSAGDDRVRIWLRANRSAQLADATGNPSGFTPYLEYCNTKWLPNNACASVFQAGGSPIHTWAVVSNGGAVPGGGISDNFDNATSVTVNGIAGFDGYTEGSTPRWPSIWQTNGNVRIQTSGSDKVLQLFGVTGTPAPRPAIARAVNLHALRAPVLEFSFTHNLGSTNGPALRLDYSFADPITTDQPVYTDDGWISLASVTDVGGVRTQAGTTPGTTDVAFNGPLSNGAINLSSGPSGNCDKKDDEYTCRIQLPPAATAATNRFSHYVKFRLRANKDLSSSETINLTNVAIKSRETPTSGSVGAATYLNWCEYSPSFPVTASFTGGFHCLGPSIDLRAVNAGGLSSNRMYIDTTDAAISFYYNREEDTRGISATAPPLGSNTGQAGPVILITNGASLANVICTRPNPDITEPTENCTTLVAENVFNPVGEYDRFNIFGRDTAPGNNCREFGVANKPCMQIVAFGADSSSSSLAGRARIAGAWIYMPWGLIGFRVNGCSGVQALTLAELNSDDSWNFGGRIWARSLYACGQTHFRVPPSSSASLSALANAPSSADINFVAWTGQDWVARASSGRTIGSVN